MSIVMEELEAALCPAGEADDTGLDRESESTLDELPDETRGLAGVATIEIENVWRNDHFWCWHRGATTRSNIAWT